MVMPATNSLVVQLYEELYILTELNFSLFLTFVRTVACLLSVSGEGIFVFVLLGVAVSQSSHDLYVYSIV